MNALYGTTWIPDQVSGFQTVRAASALPPKRKQSGAPDPARAPAQRQFCSSWRPSLVDEWALPHLEAAGMEYSYVERVPRSLVATWADKDVQVMCELCWDNAHADGTAPRVK